MNYLLDTNACIALINGNPPALRSKFLSVTRAGARVYVSVIACFELWYGVAKSSRPEVNRRRLEVFFSGPVFSLPFEDEDAEVAGEIRANLEARGKPIGAYDLLIAAQASRQGLTLVTANLSEFSRIGALKWADWGKS
jgi:tRNA(fMet)-specific endonuclease VapC